MTLTNEQVNDINTAKAMIEVYRAKQEFAKITANNQIRVKQVEINDIVSQRDGQLNAIEDLISEQQAIIDSFVSSV